MPPDGVCRGAEMGKNSKAVTMDDFQKQIWDGLAAKAAKPAKKQLEVAARAKAGKVVAIGTFGRFTDEDGNVVSDGFHVERIVAEGKADVYRAWCLSEGEMLAEAATLERVCFKAKAALNYR